MAQQARYPTATAMNISPAHILQAIPNTAVARIPETEFAISDFNSVMAGGPPFRDVPSALVAHLTNPDPASVTPNWLQFLQHFFDRDHGMGNLQDLYLMITRVLLPNQIIEMRQNFLDLEAANAPQPSAQTMQLTRPISAQDMQIVYTRAWPVNPAPAPTRQGQYIPAYRDRPTPTNTPALTRPILRSYTTPDGAAFVNWLQTPIPPAHPPYNMSPVTPQTELAIYLMDDEAWIRDQNRLHPRSLAHRTRRVLEIFWFLAEKNQRVARLRSLGWPRDGLLQL
ncbi:hypothetical protein BCR34DRAFT_11343 [Clohesyomyces aquaticus]|uniref:Uncharacterized protein n=1 Tax=Clohesyomyces aquaticus TaxID=1231657 RepID=A0A1Y1ZE07_9PLEO|nr:hypothetical protein BCR34DRAFT_11343 [Clohesyomyces aquaticus]